MAKGLIEVLCPCCQATLKIDPRTQAVIAHQAHEKPRPIEDLAGAVEKLKGESGRREDAFQRSVAAERVHGEVLAKKFDELFRQVKEKPDTGKPIRDFDLD